MQSCESLPDTARCRMLPLHFPGANMNRADETSRASEHSSSLSLFESIWTRRERSHEFDRPCEMSECRDPDWTRYSRVERKGTFKLSRRPRTLAPYLGILRFYAVGSVDLHTHTKGYTTRDATPSARPPEGILPHECVRDRPATSFSLMDVGSLCTADHDRGLITWGQSGRDLGP